MTRKGGAWVRHNAALADRQPQTRLNREQVAILADALSEQYFGMLRLTPSLIQHTMLVMLVGAQARHKAHPWTLSSIAAATHQSIFSIGRGRTC